MTGEGKGDEGVFLYIMIKIQEKDVVPHPPARLQRQEVSKARQQAFYNSGRCIMHLLAGGQEWHCTSLVSTRSLSFSYGGLRLASSEPPMRSAM